MSKRIDALKGNLTIADRMNMVFAGTIVTKGKAKIIVTATAMETEIGRIAKMITEVKKEITPLQKKLERLGKIFGIGTIIISLIILIAGIIKENLIRFILAGDYYVFLVEVKK